MMAKVVSLINMKGGVGKSTLTVNLAWHLACYTNWQKKVLVVDLDPQFNASQYLVGVNKYHDFINDGKPTIWDVFEQHKRTPSGKTKIVKPKDVIRNVVTFRGGSKIDLLPSRLELSLSLKNPTQKPELLSKLLKNVHDEYDLILIDCAPTESVLTTAAYLASDYLLVPVKPEYLSTIGLPLLVNSMSDFLTEYDDHNLELLGVVYNATSDYSPEEQHSKREVSKLADKHGWNIFDSEITYSRSYPKGAREGQPIFKTSYARTAQATKFRMFANEFGKRVGL
ncbi:ParA family protein [Vibrio parahaemolyticus]|nr:ParA family protein [Vibrio parahaemolyticus]TOQ93879.1 chromosome partitioning protein [Vibrio parahaemolyticus]